MDRANLNLSQTRRRLPVCGVYFPQGKARTYLPLEQVIASVNVVDGETSSLHPFRANLIIPAASFRHCQARPGILELFP